MQLSQQQNTAITTTLIDYYNVFLVDLVKQVFMNQCANLQGSDQIDTFMFNVQHTLKKSSEEHFNKTKQYLFEFMVKQQQNKLTENAFKTIFDKYFIPAQLQNNQQHTSGDNALQLGVILIINNLCPLFQSKVQCKKYISIIKQQKIPKDIFIQDITPILKQIQKVMHCQLLGTPYSPSDDEIPDKSEVQKRSQIDNQIPKKPCTSCKKHLKDNQILKDMLKLIEQKNKILNQIVEQFQLPLQATQQNKHVNNIQEDDDINKLSKASAKSKINLLGSKHKNSSQSSLDMQNNQRSMQIQIIPVKQQIKKQSQIIVNQLPAKRGRKPKQTIESSSEDEVITKVQSIKKSKLSKIQRVLESSNEEQKQQQNISEGETLSLGDDSEFNDMDSDYKGMQRAEQLDLSGDNQFGGNVDSNDESNETQ